MFEQAQQVATEAEALLVGEDWHVPEPEPVGIEAELVTARAGVGERRTDAPEPQRSLFSWGEFPAGGRGPSRQRRHSQGSTLSLVQWVLDREREGQLASAPF